MSTVKLLSRCAALGAAAALLSGCSAIDRLGRYLDPMVVVRTDDGHYWTPNGNHRLAALRTLGARAAVAIVVPEAEVARRILLLNTETPVLIWLALIVAGGLGFAPMIAVQPAFYAELFGAGVRYTGFAASRALSSTASAAMTSPGSSSHSG